MVAADILKAVEIANALRAEFGEPALTDLPGAVPGDSERCVLARAFNFGCTVDGRNDVWFATFEPEHTAQAEKLAELCGTAIESMPYTYDERLRVPLPADVGAIAVAFDGGQLPQYIDTESPEFWVDEDIVENDEAA